MTSAAKGAPTLEDFCNVANDLYAEPTEEHFYAVVNLAREALALSAVKWDEGYQFARSATPAPVPLGRWIKGIPPSHVDLAWLRVEYPGGHVRVVLSALATHDSNAKHPLEWCEAADWRGESVLDSIHQDGGHIRHWLPYLIPSKNWPTTDEQAAPKASTGAGSGPITQEANRG